MTANPDALGLRIDETEWATQFKFSVFQDDEEVASGEGPDRNTILREARNYTAQYAQDGPVTVYVYELRSRGLVAEDISALPQAKGER